PEACHESGRQHLLDDRSAGSQKLADAGGVLAARFREVGTAATATADDRRELFHHVPGRHAARQVRGDAHDHRDLPLARTRQHYDAALDAIAVLIDEGTEAVLVQAADFLRYQRHTGN